MATFPYDSPSPERLQAHAAAQAQMMGQKPPVPPEEEKINRWDSFLTRLSQDKNLQMAMLQGGLAAMAPRGPGQNHATALLGGLQQGTGVYNELQNQQQTRAARDAQIAQTQAITAESRARLPEVQARSDVAVKTSGDKVEQAGLATRLGKAQATKAEAEAGVAEDMATLGVENLEGIIAARKDNKKYLDEQIKALQGANAFREYQMSPEQQGGIHGQKAAIYTNIALGPRTEENAELWDRLRAVNMQIVEKGVPPSAEELFTKYSAQMKLGAWSEEQRAPMEAFLRSNIRDIIDSWATPITDVPGEGIPSPDLGTNGAPVTPDEGAFDPSTVAIPPAIWDLTPEGEKARTAAILGAMEQGMSLDEAVRAWQEQYKMLLKQVGKTDELDKRNPGQVRRDARAQS